MKKLIGFLLALALGASAFGQLRLENLFQNSNLADGVEAFIVYTINR